MMKDSRDQQLQVQQQEEALLDVENLNEAADVEGNAVQDVIVFDEVFGWIWLIIEWIRNMNCC